MSPLWEKWVGGIMLSFMFCLLIMFSFYTGQIAARKEACRVAGGILLEGEYCLPKTQVLKLTSP